jgi:hypothetical protein
LHQQKQVSTVSHTKPDGQLTFRKWPAVRVAWPGGLSLGKEAQFVVNFLGLDIADQPQAAQAEGGQHQSGQQCRQQGQSQTERADHANLRKR